MSNVITVRQQGLDKFYTKPEIVDKCIMELHEYYKFNNFDLIIEPSAGNGNFLLKLPKNKRIGIDIEPDNTYTKEIIKQDFLTFLPKQVENILTIGNPPFGKICSLAIKFFNHSAKFSNVIAFIIPKTFRKISIQNKLDLNFHLVHDSDIPNNPCSFEPNMSVKCCFQIYTRKNIKRNIILQPITHNDFEFLQFGPKDANNQPTPPITNNLTDFAIRAYGGKCGEIKLLDLNELRPKSWHFIRSKIDKNILIHKFNKLDYSKSENTARQNSLGKAELVNLYTNSE